MKNQDFRKALPWIIALAVFGIAWALTANLSSKGLPAGPLLDGLVQGAVTALNAMGLVLVYRSARIINFAQVEIGGVASSVAVVLMLGSHFNFYLAVVVGLAAAVLLGVLIDRIVIWRFQNAPRLILTVATIGLLNIFGAIEVVLPNLYPTGTFSSVTGFRLPFQKTLTLQGFGFNANHLAAVIIVPLCLLALWAFMNRTDVGTAIRASADSPERALLLGIPIRRLSLITWMIAGLFAGLSAILSSITIGATTGSPLGASVLIAPLAAAAIGRFENLPVTFAASLGLGMFQQGVFWSHPNSAFVDLVYFLAIFVAIFAQPQMISRVSDIGLGGFRSVQDVRPLPRSVLKHPSVKALSAVAVAVIVFVVIVLPSLPLGFFSPTHFDYLATMALYAMIAVSMVVLTGWAGQISLGQFAFAGAGASMTGVVLVSWHWSFFVAIPLSAAVGALLAVVIGVPALRIPHGLYLAVITLAFSVPITSYFISGTQFPTLAPQTIPQPTILNNRFDLSNQKTFYFVCVFFLAITLVLARNIQRSRAGRVIRAIRDNTRAASSYGASPLRTRLFAFAFSGAIAGIAGGLYAISLGGIPQGGFDLQYSIDAFSIVVVGGMGSLLGGVLGAVVIEGLLLFVTSTTWHFFLEGGFLLLILFFIPQGLGGVVFQGRDWLIRRLVPEEGDGPVVGAPEEEEESTVIPGPAHDAALRLGALEDLEVASKAVGRAPQPTTVVDPAAALIAAVEVDAGYGKAQILYEVSMEVAPQEILALLGTNGAGKSTMLRVFAGILDAKSGKVYLQGEDITKLPPIDRVKRGLVTVPGGRGVFGSLTVRENLRLAGWLNRKDRPFLTEALGRVFSLFPTLQHRLDVRANLLSGGEQQMLTLSQALLCRPKVLLIDELSIGLAPTVVAELLNAVRALSASGVTVVVVEQSVNVATAIAGRAVFMERGQVRFSGPTPSVEQQPNLLRSVFLRAATRAHSRPKSEHEQARFVDRQSVTAFGVKDVSKVYGGVAALDGVSLSVSKGEILGIIGANGAGKTTLFDVCSGFLTPETGRVVMEGVDITGLRPHQRATRGLGRVFQDAQLFPSLTVAEVLAVALERHVEVRDPLANMLGLDAVAVSEEKVADRVDELIEEMGLARWRNAFVTELSTGTRRVVDLACAMAHRPRVLLLDEPSSGIAQRESEAMGELLLGLRSETGASFIVIEHDVPLVSYVSDRLICLHLGRTIAEGETSAVLEDPGVIAAYLGRDEAAIQRTGLVHPQQPVGVASAPGPIAQPVTAPSPSPPAAPPAAPPGPTFGQAPPA